MIFNLRRLVFLWSAADVGAAGAGAEVFGQAVVVAQQGGADLQDRFAAHVRELMRATADGARGVAGCRGFFRAVPELFCFEFRIGSKSGTKGFLSLAS